MADLSARGAQLRALAQLASHGPAAVAQRQVLKAAFGAAARLPPARKKPALQPKSGILAP